MVVIYSRKGRTALESAGRPKPELACAPLDELGPPSADEAFAYLDCRSLETDEIVALARKLGKTRAPARWGLLDFEGRIEDPAAWMREGCGDYLGPAFKGGVLEAKRLKSLSAWAERLQAPAAEEGNVPASAEGAKPASRGRKAASPAACAESFPGWKAIQPGAVREFFFYYLSIDRAQELRDKLGERHYAEIRDRLAAWLSQAFAGTDALEWMRTESSSLYLIPTEGERAAQAVEASLRLLLNLPLLSHEQFKLGAVLPLVLALHRGECTFREPGKTGTVVSDDVNFIFHLGSKRAKPFRLTLSAQAACAVRPELDFLFPRDGDFEGRDLRRSRRFISAPLA